MEHVAKRERSADDPAYFEEDLQIFSKKPKLINGKPNKKGLSNTAKKEIPAEEIGGLRVKTEPAPGCSFVSTKYPPPEKETSQYKKPRLNYRQLAFLAMKNANFIPMQTPQICDFVEAVFPYYSHVSEKTKLAWRNALSGAVRTGKCDEGLFTTSSVYGSGLRMFYGVRKHKIEQMEKQIDKWKTQFHRENVNDSGVDSIEELKAICNGTKGIEIVIKDLGGHVEKWKKSQLPVSKLEDFDIEEKKKEKLASSSEVDASEFLLTPTEEKMLARRAKKNAPITCEICRLTMNIKSFGRHMRLIHKFSPEDLHRHRLEIHTRKMEQTVGNELDNPILCTKCQKEFGSSVVLDAHFKICNAEEEEEEDEEIEGEEQADYGDIHCL